MPRPSKGARLWLKPASSGRGARWIIKDGDARISTGFCADDRELAEKALRDYLVKKHEPVSSAVGRDPSDILIADALTVYGRDMAPSHARPYETGRRIVELVKFFGSRSIGEINGDLCRAYAAQRPSQSAARRELEDLRAAIRNLFADEAFTPRVNIQMPEKSPPRERWLTRQEAAKLLRVAWRRSQPAPGLAGGVRHVSRHVARFILVGLYTGTRSAAICGAAIRPTIGRGYVDLERGVFYRRPPGTVETTKRQPPVRLPRRLLAHLRRWERLGLCEHSVVEWEGKEVDRVSKSFRRVVLAAGLDGVSPHTLRHTSITWAMQAGVQIWDASSYFGVSEKLIRSTYGHHHPDHQRGVTDAFDRRGDRRTADRLRTETM